MTSSIKKPPSFEEALIFWIKIACYSFGGPTNQIAVMHQFFVEEKKWITEARFLNALNYCMLLPGPEAHQLLIYIAWMFHGYQGGVIAGSLFVLPGFLSILFLSILYAKYHSLMLVQGLFYGLKPAVIAVVLVALIKIGQKTLTSQFRIATAFLAFVAIFFLKLPFPLIIIFAGLVSYSIGRRYSHLFLAKSQELEMVESARPTSILQTLKVASIWIILWFTPTLVLIMLLGRESVFSQEAIFFTKMATVSIGGAYAVLSYVAQQAVQFYHWLSPTEMLDGLGMAETTPGPLIQVVQFVGFMAAFRNPGTLDPLTSAILGSILTIWVTFVPSFLWIFIGAPYIEKLRHNQSLHAALSGVTAAVVGVILNLALWFSLNTFFPHIDERAYAFIHVPIPDWVSFQYEPFFLTIGSLILMLKYKRSLFTTFCFAVVLGLIISWLKIG